MGNKAFQVKSGDLFWFPADELVIVGLDTDDGPENPLYDDRIKLPVSNELVRNVISRGIIKPIVVMKGPENLAYVVDGRQRTRAAREADKRLYKDGAKDTHSVLVPAVYRRGDEASLFDVAVSANEFHIIDDPIAKAKKAQRLLDLGRTYDEIAQTFGVTSTTIKNWLTLGEASPELKSAVEDGKISPSAALPIARLPREKQSKVTVVALDSAKPGRKPTARQAKAAAKGDKPETKKRMRGRPEVEFAMVHHPNELEKITGVTALRWVLCHIELEELSDRVDEPRA